MGEKVYLNGWMGTFEEAWVSVNDRGYIFGDGIYEVIRVYGGNMFALREHIDRLENSAREIDMELPAAKEELKAICKNVLEASGIKEAIIYIQVTRGSAPRNHFYSSDLKPNLLVTVRQMPRIPSYIYDQGIKVITRHDLRWSLCNIKTISLQANILAKNRARKYGADEVVFVCNDGTITECGSKNIFIYKDETLFTHPADNKILPGITRKYVLDIAESLNLDVKIAPFNKFEMLKAEEVFCTNTVEEIIPVVSIDEHTIGEGRPGPVTQRLHKEFINLRSGPYNSL